MPGCAFSLVADEQNVMSFIAQQGVEVIDDATAAAHATGYDDGWTCSLGQMFDDAPWAVYCNQLFERQRATPGLTRSRASWFQYGFNVR